MIVIVRRCIEEIIRHATNVLPEEGCGLLGGIIDGDMRVVHKAYILTNVDHTEDHFTMDVREQFMAVKDMREKGWMMLGNFHSHPKTPARPSEEDIRLAYDTNVSYMILSLAGEQPVIKSFRIADGLVAEEDIRIVEI